MSTSNKVPSQNEEAVGNLGLAGLTLTRRHFLAAGLGWASLSLLPKNIQAGPFVSGENLVNVSGKVSGASAELLRKGVWLSNGFKWFRADNQGNYSMEVETLEYPFVVIHSPRGYRPGSTHFRRFSDKSSAAVLDFVLTPSRERESDSLRIAVVSDTHFGMQDDAHFVHDGNFKNDYETVARLGKPDFMINCGDVTDYGDPRAIEHAMRISGAMPFPVFSVYGNHDSDLDRPHFSSIERVRNKSWLAGFGPDQYSFEWGRYLFINCGIFFPGAEVRIPRMEGWLDGLLERTPNEQPIVLFAHDKPYFHPEPHRRIYGPLAEKFADRKGGVIVLHGHHHSTMQFRHRNMQFWEIPPLSFGGIDSSPRGFALLELTPEKKRLSYRQLFGVSAKEVEWKEDRVATNLPERFEAIWRKKITGLCHRSEPQIAGDHIFLTPWQTGSAEEHGVVCLDARTGVLQWMFPTNSGVKYGVEVDQERGRVYFVESVGKVTALDLASGQEVWSTELSFFPDRYYYCRPVMTPEGLVLGQHRGSFLLDPDDGSILWEVGEAADNNRSAVHQIPVVHEDKVVFMRFSFLGSLSAVCLDLKDGHKLWETVLFDRAFLDRPWTERFFQSIYPSPLMCKEGVIVPGGAGVVTLLAIETGDIIWQKNLFDVYGVESGNRSKYRCLFEQPIGFYLNEGSLFGSLTSGCIVSIDLASGHRNWVYQQDETPLLDYIPYHRGVNNVLTQVVEFDGLLWSCSAAGFLVGLNPSTGREALRINFESPFSSPPGVYKDQLVVSLFSGEIVCLKPQEQS